MQSTELQGGQTKAREHVRTLRLPILSPYFQRKDFEEDRQIGRNTHISDLMKAYLDGFIVTAAGTSYAEVTFVDDNAGNAFVANTFVPSDFSADTSSETIFAQAKTDILAYAVTQGYGTTSVFGMFATTNGVVQTRTVSQPSLAVNTARQPSATFATLVNASVDITTTLSLSGGTSGKVALQQADNSGFTTGVITIAQYTNSNTGTLTLGLNTSQIGTAVLTAYIPAGKYYRLQTTNITGTPTYSTPVITETVGI